MKLDLDQDVKGILEPERAFDRRDFLTTALGASAALAASAPVSAQEINTDAQGLEAGDVTIKVADSTMEPGRNARITMQPILAGTIQESGRRVGAES